MVYHFIIGKNITMKNSIIILITCLFFSCSVNNGFRNENEDVIRFNYNFYLLKNNLVQFEIDYFIPYSKLIFNKKSDGFYSNITLSINLIDDNNNIYNHSWSDNIYVNYFEDTKSKNDYTGHITFVAEKKQQYLMTLSINDYDNHKYYKYEQNISINDYQYLSDIQLYIKNNDNYSNIDNLENSRLKDLDTLWIKYQIIDDDISDNSLTLKMFNKDIDNVTSFVSTLKGSELKNYEIVLYPISLGNISYKNLEINCYYKDVHKFKSIRISDEEEVVFDYTLLFSPMKNYMFNHQEYLEYIELDSTQKIEYIGNYWLEKDNPDLLNEFYKRVEYSNANFKKIGFDGSDSDQGKIYIIYGKPLNIDFEFNENGEFEIWQYNNKRFVFINRFGYFECYQC